MTTMIHEEDRPPLPRACDYTRHADYTALSAQVEELKRDNANQVVFIKDIVDGMAKIGAPLTRDLQESLNQYLAARAHAKQSGQEEGA